MCPFHNGECGLHVPYVSAWHCTLFTPESGASMHPTFHTARPQSTLSVGPHNGECGLHISSPHSKTTEHPLSRASEWRVWPPHILCIFHTAWHCTLFTAESGASMHPTLHTARPQSTLSVGPQNGGCGLHISSPHSKTTVHPLSRASAYPTPHVA